MPEPFPRQPHEQKTIGHDHTGRHDQQRRHKNRQCLGFLEAIQDHHQHQRRKSHKTQVNQRKPGGNQSDQNPGIEVHCRSLLFSTRRQATVSAA